MHREGGLGAVICTAGGWAGGSLAQPAEAVEGAEAMIEACYKTALSSETLTARALSAGAASLHQASTR